MSGTYILRIRKMVSDGCKALFLEHCVDLNGVHKISLSTTTSYSRMTVISLF